MQVSSPADRADIRRELGDLDDLTVARIQAVGPTVAHLVEARIRLAQGDVPGVVRGGPPPIVAEIVQEVRDALRRVEEEEAEV